MNFLDFYKGQVLLFYMTLVCSTSYHKHENIMKILQVFLKLLSSLVSSPMMKDSSRKMAPCCRRAPFLEQVLQVFWFEKGNHGTYRGRTLGAMF